MSAAREPRSDDVKKNPANTPIREVEKKRWETAGDAGVSDEHAELASAPVTYGAHRIVNDYDRTKHWSKVLLDSHDREDVRSNAAAKAGGYYADTLHAEEIQIIMIDTPAGPMYFDKGGAKIVSAGLVDAQRVDYMLERREQLIESRTEGIAHAHERVRERVGEVMSLKGECASRAAQIKELHAQIETLKSERRAARREASKLRREFGVEG